MKKQNGAQSASLLHFMEISGGLTFTRFTHKFTLPRNVKLSNIIRYNIQSCIRHYQEYQEFFVLFSSKHTGSTFDIFMATARTESVRWELVFFPLWCCFSLLLNPVLVSHHSPVLKMGLIWRSMMNQPCLRTTSVEMEKTTDQFDSDRCRQLEGDVGCLRLCKDPACFFSGGTE